MSSRPFDYQDELLALMGTLVNVIFCAKTADGAYVEVNSAFVRRTGQRSKRDVIGKTAHDLFIAELAERYSEQDRHITATGEALRDELELIRRANGDLGWYLTTKLPIFDRDEPGRVVGLVSVSRDLEASADNGEAVEVLQPVVRYVRANLADTISVGALAEVAGCSVDQLDRRIRRVFGLTTKQYVLRVRVDRACELLATTNMALAEVGATVGFYDQSDFTRRFARLTNQTPAQFRAANTASNHPTNSTDLA